MSDPDIRPVADADRTAAIDQLRALHADGQMDQAELTTRIQAIHGATSPNELAAITSDRAEPPSNPATSATRRTWMVSLFGDVTRSGTWRAQETMAPISLFGDIELDLRHTTIPVGDVTITALTPFGNIEVLVPDGVEVEVGGLTLFGSKKIAYQRVPPSDRDPQSGCGPTHCLGASRCGDPKRRHRHTRHGCKVARAHPLGERAWPFDHRVRSTQSTSAHPTATDIAVVSR